MGDFDQKLKETYDKIDYDTFINYCIAYLNNPYTIKILGNKGPTLKFSEDDLRFIRQQLESLRGQISPVVYKKYERFIRVII